MNTPLSRVKRTWANAESGADGRNRYLWSERAGVRLSDFAASTSLAGRREELAGESVLVVARDQLAAALALIELDGVAARIILCADDFGVDQLRSIISAGSANAIVSDQPSSALVEALGIRSIACSVALTPDHGDNVRERRTEWVLLSSGTSSGRPKLVVHTLASLIAPVSRADAFGPGIVWGTFYDIRRYGGLQIFLRAILGGGSMVLSKSGERPGDHIARLRIRRATHVSGTPTHWRRIVMSGEAFGLTPEYVRLSGEIADQAILDKLRAAFPASRIVHAFASTEAGVAFEVPDGLSGFPADFAGVRDGVEVKVENSSLHIRSNATALQYLGDDHTPLRGGDGFVDTGDVVELRDGRYYFLGRKNGIINIGGMKVHPEEIEAVINRHPRVAMSAVRARKNPIIGAVVAADVVLKTDEPVSEAKVEEEIFDLCRRHLPPHKAPATLRFVVALDIAEAGKLARSNA
jgi:acyl-CoA synthetase (AMP-forming)/AMP-acid ligase II